MIVRRIARAAKKRTTKHVVRRGLQWEMQRIGMNRYEARRQAFGPTRREATSHPSRAQALNERVRLNAARRRWRRRQAVASAIAVAEAAL